MAKNEQLKLRRKDYGTWSMGTSSLRKVGHSTTTGPCAFALNSSVCWWAILLSVMFLKVGWAILLLVMFLEVGWAMLLSVMLTMMTPFARWLLLKGNKHHVNACDRRHTQWHCQQRYLCQWHRRQDRERAPVLCGNADEGNNWHWLLCPINASAFCCRYSSIWH
jgi:hypothetical protein